MFSIFNNSMKICLLYNSDTKTIDVEIQRNKYGNNKPGVDEL